MKILLILLLASFNGYSQDISNVTNSSEITSTHMNSLVNTINKIRNLEVYSESQESISDNGTTFFILAGNVIHTSFPSTQGSGLYSYSNGVITILKDNVEIMTVAGVRLDGSNNIYVYVDKGTGYDLKTATTEGVAGYLDTLIYKETLNNGDKVRVQTDGTGLKLGSEASNFYIISAKRKAKIGELIDIP